MFQCDNKECGKIFSELQLVEFEVDTEKGVMTDYDYVCPDCSSSVWHLIENPE